MFLLAMGIGLLAVAALMLLLWPGSSRARIALAGAAIVVLCASALLHAEHRWVEALFVFLGIVAIGRELGFLGLGRDAPHG